MKKTSLLLLCIFSLLTSYCTDQGETKTYVYTVKNESGVKMKIRGYPESGYNPEPYIINLEDGGELTKTYKDGLPPRGYDFRFFFGDTRRADSLKVIYGNTKYKDYNYRNASDTRNPIFHLTGNLKETYIFTEEDYANAEDCDGACE